MQRPRKLLVSTLCALLGALAVCWAASTSLGAGGPRVQGSAVDVQRLPLGDGRYLTRARKGYVYSCITRFGGGGAFVQGPWIDAAARRWDATRKIAVAGSVAWASRFSTRLGTRKRRLSGNGLPPHRTGVFPIRPSDPAYAYDRNPNSIRSYTLRASLPRNPKLRSRRSCVGGTIGVMRNGVPLYSAFDAGGRDAVATEVQDACGGHPQVTGQYHYHSLTSCLRDRRRSHSRLLGWALDGFGIYGLRGKGGALLSTSKLDACHGHTHRISWNGGRRRMYHYHATLDFPYVVSCYRGRAITEATGLGIGGGGPMAGPPPPPPPPY